MYGSSLRMETLRPRALRRRPMEAAVMPLPSEEVTPPVTKTYFAMGTGPPGVFPMLSIRGTGDKTADVAVGGRRANLDARRPSFRALDQGARRCQSGSSV